MQVIHFHLPLLATVEILILSCLHELLRVFFLSVNCFPVIFAPIILHSKLRILLKAGFVWGSDSTQEVEADIFLGCDFHQNKREWCTNWQGWQLLLDHWAVFLLAGLSKELNFQIEVSKRFGSFPTFALSSLDNTSKTTHNVRIC